MDSFEILVSRYMLEKGCIGLIIIGLIVAVLISLTVIFSVKYLKRQEEHNDIFTAVYNDTMSDTDNTD